MASERLTEKQRKFCDFYIKNPNASEAAILAGYSAKMAGSIGYANLQLPKVREAISVVNERLASDRIADMVEVKEYWTAVLRDDDEATRERLRASEFLAKTNGAFLDRVEVEDAITVNVRRVKNGD